MKIGSNIFSSIPQRHLSRTAQALQTSLERLSSGKRINSAQDDVAGFIMSVNLDSNIRGSTQAIRNANDGMSMLTVAEGAMNEMTNILQSIRELAVQAANGTLSSNERTTINDQVAGLLEEYDRIANGTDFNGIKLLNGSFGTKTLDIGPGATDLLNIQLDNLRKTDVFEKTVGTGTFQQKVSYNGGSSPVAVAAGDLNGDGIADLAEASVDDNAVNVLLGNGDGTFRPKVSYYGGIGPASIAMADVNGDKVLDLVEISDGLSTLNVFTGNGDGTFKPRVSYSDGEGYSLKMADLNGDGICDIVSDNSIFIANGDGTFKARVSYDVGGGVYGVSLGDVNADGAIDSVMLVCTGEDLYQVNLLLGNGDGTFKVGTLHDEAFTPNCVADINRDGVADVVGTIGSYLGVMIGNGDGTFKAAVTSDGYGIVNVADVNGDGVMDVISASNVDQKMYVLVGNGDGTFKAKVGYSDGNGVGGVATADVNGDGVTDVITATESDQKINVFIGNNHTVTAVSDMNLTSQVKAQQALSIIDQALATLSKDRASLGSTQNRLEAVVSNLYTSRENLSRAYSEIMDSDIALDTAELVRNQILQQAGIAVLAQANVMQASVMELLKY